MAFDGTYRVASRAQGGLAVVVVLAALPACTTSPDVVAGGTTPIASGAGGGLFVDDQLVSKCKAGHYEGYSLSVPGDGGVGDIGFSAFIAFSLVQGPSKEFLVIKNNSTLTGQTQRDPRVTFGADIVDGSCLNGNVSSTLKNGHYDATDPPIMFEGEIRGTFTEPDGSPAQFLGRWTSRVALGLGTVPIGGTWFAQRTGPAQ